VDEEGRGELWEEGLGREGGSREVGGRGVGRCEGQFDSSRLCFSLFLLSVLFVLQRSLLTKYLLSLRFALVPLHPSHQAEHSLLLSLLPTPSLSPTLTILLTQILTPTLTYLSSTLLSVVQALKKEPLPWKAYTIYEALDNVSVKWDEFVRAAGLSGNATMKGVVRDVLGSGTGLKGLCLRSLPEAVEGAKVS